MGDQTDERANPLAPRSLCDKISQLVKDAGQLGNLKRGANESTKAVNRNLAKLVVIAADTKPLEIVLHLPLLCEEKSIAFVYVPSKSDLGRDSSSTRNATAVAILGEDKRYGGSSELMKKVEAVVSEVEQLILQGGGDEN